MTRKTSRWAAALGFVSAFSLAVLLPACKQSKGERCQLDSDCECGTCVVVSGQEGLCCEGALVPQDAATTVDANMSMDSSVDSSVSPDVVMSVDSRPPDATVVVPDSALPDAAIDSSVAADAATADADLTD